MVELFWQKEFTFYLRLKKDATEACWRCSDRMSESKKKRVIERLKEEADDTKKIKKILLRVKRWRGGHGKRETGRAGRQWRRASTNEACG